ncbi:MAG: DUF3500 domain-containing protein [Verrucomicrobiota bacterium]
MKSIPELRTFLVVGLLLHSTCLFLRAHSPAEDMAEAAANFLAALTPEQQAKATFDLKHEERLNWHFIPRERQGLPFKELTPAQRPLAHGLIATALSQRGYLKVATIMSLEQILLELEQGKGPKRDPELYYLSIFGQPGAKATWAWRVEGHHLSLNFTVVNGQHVSVTPSFFGSNPGEVRSGPRKGLRVLAAEEDLARQLVQSLSEEQKPVAIYTNTAPSDIITSADRKARLLSPDGLALGKMTKPQADQLWNLIREYVYRYRPELADQDLKKITAAGPDKIFFAWAGSVQPGQPHYYRVQGPTFLMEYDNTQNNANHIHAVWRDLQNDFGEDLLRKHYEQTPHQK